MCLENGFRKPTERQSGGFGWKAFRIADRSGGLLSVCGYFQRIFKAGRWLNEQYYRIYSSKGKKYLSPLPEGFGWHVFKRKVDALRYAGNSYRVFKVEYRKATAIGITEPCYTDGVKCPTIVAKEILIIK